jgi:trans-2,3-dihydro-3-hydroxyanthranilate isomerase
MRVDIAWWDLKGSGQTIESLREHLRDGTVDAWTDVPGLRLKFWMADKQRNRWGAVMLWESNRAPRRLMPPNRAAELIGYPPTHRAQFNVEATVEGAYRLAALTGIGPALTERHHA